MRYTLIVVQAALAVVCTLVALIYQGQDSALAAVYGGGVAIGSTWLLVKRVARAGELAKTNLKWSAYSLYFGAIQRFVFVLAMLGVGLGVIRLDPVPLLATFGIAQLGYIIAAGKQAMG